jgi:hypothetical protein
MNESMYLYVKFLSNKSLYKGSLIYVPLQLVWLYAHFLFVFCFYLKIVALVCYEVLKVTDQNCVDTSAYEPAHSPKS